jgi:large subunit ribosomal protein L5
MKQNIMRQIEIEKMVINCGGIDEKLERSIKLLEMITGRKVQKIKSTKRIPTFGISPGKLSGVKVTIRERDEIINLLKRFFAAIDNKLRKNNVVKNHLSFGIKEYIEIPGLEYNRDIGILGFEVSVVFTRKGKRASLRKIKRGKYPERQSVSRDEIVEYLTKTFKVGVGKK